MYHPPYCSSVPALRSGIRLLAVLLLMAIALPRLISAELGMKAPPLKVSEWVQGPAVTVGGSNTNIVVVEFWATWCGPCRVTLPNLSELQRRFRTNGVSFVGISDESGTVVAPYVKKMGDKMSFSVAVDEESATSKAYLGGFGIRGIPHAFVINRAGRVVWQGHPLAGLDQALEDLVGGRFDMAKAQAAGEFTQDVQRYLVMTSTAGATPESARLGRKLLEEASGQPELLRRLAWMILTDGRIHGRDLPLALEAAEKANLATAGRDPECLTTYARALFDSGKQEQGIEMQKKAIELIAEPENKAAAKRTLEDYLKRLSAIR